MNLTDIMKKMVSHLNPTNEPVAYVFLVIIVLQLLFGEEVVNQWIDTLILVLSGALSRSQVRPKRRSVPIERSFR